MYITIPIIDIKYFEGFVLNINFYICRNYKLISI